MGLLTQLQESAFSGWVLISMLGFPTLIALHSVGMGVAVGLSLMVALRLNGALLSINAPLLPRLLTIAIWGFILNTVTGLALFVSRAAEYTASSIFLLKMSLVLVSAIVLFWLRQRLTPMAQTTTVVLTDNTAKYMSILFTLTWFGAVIAGRLIAYLSDLY